MPPFKRSAGLINSLPTIEERLTETQRDLLSEAVSEGVQASNAAVLPPPGSVVQGFTTCDPIVTPPPETSASAMQARALEAMAVVAGACGDKSVGAAIAQMAKDGLNSTGAPIETASASGIKDGKKFTVPASVRDVPNKFIADDPATALTYWLIFTEELSDKESDAITDLAAMKGFPQKPLLWFSQKLWENLVIDRWSPARESTIKGFHPDDADTSSNTYRALEKTFGPDLAQVLVNTAERLNLDLRGLLKLAALKMLDNAAADVAKISSYQTVNTWKRKR